MKRAASRAASNEAVESSSRGASGRPKLADARDGGGFKRDHAVNASIDFGTIGAAALRSLPQLASEWLPDGRQEGAEWVARNPRRTDRRPGSFKVNLSTGKWADFATGD